MKVSKNMGEQPREWLQILAILSACLPSLSGAVLFGWSSPSIPRIVADKVNYDISLEEASYFTVIPPLGMVATCQLFPYLNNAIGRKYSLLLITVPQTLALLLAAVATSKWVFYASRFFAGMADSCIFSTMTIYVAEIASPKIRGTWGNLLTFNMYFGQFLINWYGSYLSISTAAFVSLAMPLFFFLTFILMPESPYYFLMKRRTEEARTSLQKLRGLKNVDDELASLKSDVERQMSETGKWSELVTVRSNRRALISCIFLRVSQQTAGVAVFEVYSQFIFEEAGSTLSPTISAMIFTGLLSVLNLCAAFTLDRFGRRKSYFYSLLFAGIILLIESGFFYCDQFYKDVVNLEAFKWVPLGGMMAWTFFYSFGLGIVPTLMLGELFSASIKGKALSLLNIIFAILISGGTKLFQVLTVNVGLFSPFFLYSISCLVSTVLSLYLVPETKGKTLEQIQLELSGSKKRDDSKNDC